MNLNVYFSDGNCGTTKRRGSGRNRRESLMSKPEKSSRSLTDADIVTTGVSRRTVLAGAGAALGIAAAGGAALAADGDKKKKTDKAKGDKAKSAKGDKGKKKSKIEAGRDKD